MDVQQEDTSLPTVDSHTLFQQGSLLRTMFSTPHPLLQMSQKHHQSLEKEDRDDVD